MFKCRNGEGQGFAQYPDGGVSWEKNATPDQKRSEDALLPPELQEWVKLGKCWVAQP